MTEMMGVAHREFSTSIIYVQRFKGKLEYNERKMDIAKKQNGIPGAEKYSF